MSEHSGTDLEPVLDRASTLESRRPEPQTPEAESLSRALGLRAGVYMGWVGHMNLGDEAMYDFCRQRFPEVRWCRHLDVSYAPHPTQSWHRGGLMRLLRLIKEEFASQRRLRLLREKVLHKLAHFSGREVAMLGGGTLINRNLNALETYVSLRCRTGTLVPTFGSGVHDPEFWLGREKGWRDLRKQWVVALAELPAAGVRGPLSKALLEDAGARNVTVCGDPAVAFHSYYAAIAPPVRSHEKLRVGINHGECSGQLWGKLQDVEDCLVALVKWLSAAGHLVEIIPVWQEDVARARELAWRAGLDRTVVTPVSCTAAAFLTRVEQLDLLISLKLHAGVLAAAANVPFVSLEYQPKCRDFAASIGWEDLTIRTDELTSDRLIDLTAALMNELGPRREHLCREMCRLQKRFAAYCDQIEPLLLM